ncbi:hypothetical protein JCM6882_006937 [Rhodosporidiobolus microsporus]
MLTVRPTDSNGTYLDFYPPSSTSSPSALFRCTFASPHPARCPYSIKATTRSDGQYAIELLVELHSRECHNGAGEAMKAWNRWKVKHSMKELRPEEEQDKAGAGRDRVGVEGEEVPLPVKQEDLDPTHDAPSNGHFSAPPTSPLDFQPPSSSPVSACPLPPILTQPFPPSTTPASSPPPPLPLSPVPSKHSPIAQPQPGRAALLSPSSLPPPPLPARSAANVPFLTHLISFLTAVLPHAATNEVGLLAAALVDVGVSSIGLLGDLVLVDDAGPRATTDDGKLVEETEEKVARFVEGGLREVRRAFRKEFSM